MAYARKLISGAFFIGALWLAPSLSAEEGSERYGVNSPEQADQWRAIGELPDWSGVWDTDRQNEYQNFRDNHPPWNEEAQKVIDFQTREMEEGRPHLVLWGCFPHGMPSWMMISHNAMEIIFSPGRVTMLGEVDGNRMRRIYTDGREHPEDPDLTMHGHSVGHWEGDTLVVDTVGIAPQSPIAQSEGVGISNNGNMRVIERIRLVGPDRLEDKITIIAPEVFTEPWTTTSYFTRLRGPQYDIVEGQCVRGYYEEGVDEFGNATFVPGPETVRGGVVPDSQQTESAGPVDASAPRQE